MSRTDRRRLALSLAFVAAVASCLPAGQPEPSKTPASKMPVKRAPGGIIISRETTFITGPLRKDGSVDYAAALNARYSQGVTPENNAAVLLLQAMGPGEIDDRRRPQFFEMLGIAPLPEKGRYLEPFRDYFERKTAGDGPSKESAATDVSDRALAQRERITVRPWSPKDSPIAAAWLEENQRQIDLIVEATTRPRYYLPLADGDDPGLIIAAALPPVQTVREAAFALRIRAMSRIAVGRPDEAWRDVAACHRLARLTAQAPTLVDGLVAIAVEQGAVEADATLAHEGALTAKQARQFAAEFQTLPATMKMADRLDWGERLFFLGCVVTASRDGPGSLLPFGEDLGLPKGKLSSFMERVAAAMIDWNEPMRMGNRSYDRIVAALAKPTRRERDAAFVGLDRQVEKEARDAKDPRVLLHNIVQAGSLRGGLGRQMGHVVVALFLPALSGAINAEDRNTTNDSMVPVVFALAAYRADHGTYPAELAALVPKYVPAVPEDLFSGEPLRYKRAGPGYVLYSVGLNGKDDGGRARFDEPYSPENQDCDDIAISVPVGKKEAGRAE